MSEVGGSWFCSMVIDGDNISGNIRSTKPLVQMYQPGTGKCIPDWSIAANQPVVYPVARSQNEGTIKPVVASTDKWYYNGVQITFNDTNVATAPAVIANKAKRITYNNGSVNVPALQIIGNLAGASNMDADIIRMEGDVEASGHTLSFNSDISLAISEYSDSTYNGFLYVTNGGIVDSEHTAVNLTPELYKGGSKMTAGYTLKWYKMPATVSFSTANSVSIGVSAIDSRLTIRCEFIVNAVVVAEAFVELSDETDPFFLDTEFSGPSQLTSSGATSSVDITYKVKRVGTGEVITGFSFSTVVTGAKGQPIVLKNAPTATGCKVTFDDVKGAGGNITGYVTGTKA